MSRTADSPPLVLASRSPRRHALLEDLGLQFHCDAARDDGPVVPGGADLRVLGHARSKAEEVHTRHPDRWVLAGDTLVVIDGECLPQPRDRAHAETMLRRLSGRVHEVWTGTVVRDPTGRSYERADRAEVRFDPLTADQLAAWLDGGAWRGKAGAYGIQDAGAGWAHLQSGAFGTVVGMDAETVLALLAEAGLPQAGRSR